MQTEEHQGEERNRNRNSERIELRHDAVQPYPKVFSIVFAATLLYLIAIFLFGGGDGHSAGH